MLYFCKIIRFNIKLKPHRMNSEPYTPKPGYPHYEEGMTLPEGIRPPMQGFTHEILVTAGCQAAFDFMIENGVDRVLANETMFAMAAYVIKAFENEFLEYKIAEWFNRDLDNPEVRLIALREITDDVPLVAITAAKESLSGSPILDLGSEFCAALMNALQSAMKTQLLTLVEKPAPQLKSKIPPYPGQT